jgi:hypothetical protein
MDKNEKLNKIKLFLENKEKEEIIFDKEFDKINEELYAKKINPYLIKYLNFTSSSVEKLNEILKKAEGSFSKKKNTYTIEQYEKGCLIYESLKENEDRDNDQSNIEKLTNDFCKLFNIEELKDNSLENIQFFLDQVNEILKDNDFKKRYNVVTLASEFKRYFKAILDERMNILRRAILCTTGVTILGVWELENTATIDEPSYLLCHCTKSYESCWPIITEGLKINKSHGGRCGKGIYFSNDVSKCIMYTNYLKVNDRDHYTVLFWVQVYTGKIKQITADNSNLTQSKEYDCIHARGACDITNKEKISHSDGTSSTVFTGKLTYNEISSTFANNEFVIYDEKRCRIKYIMLLNKKNMY